MEIEEIAKKWFNEQTETVRPKEAFEAGYELAKFIGSSTDDILAELKRWTNKDAVDNLILQLLKSKQLSYTKLTDKYLSYLEEINAEKQALIVDLGTSLMTYRRKIYMHNEISEVEKRADEVLKRTNMFNL